MKQSKKRSKSGKRQSYDRNDKDSRIKETAKQPGKQEMLKLKGEPKNGSKERDHDGNDISWHVRSEQILKDIATLPFAQVLRGNITVPYSDANGNTIATARFSTPGVLAIRFQPSYGSVFTQNPGPEMLGRNWSSDPLNIACKAMRAFLRSQNSGSTNNLDDVDYMQYVLAMDSVYMLYTWMVRIYGFMRTYNYKNRYAPNGILRAMGLSDNQIKQLYDNMAQFRYLINNTALRMSSLAVPTIFPIISRHLWMCANVYMDADDPKAQFYLFNPISLYKYTEESGTLECVVFEDYLSTGSILTKLGNFVNDLLTPLLYSQSVGIMSGDILKAYGSSIYSFSTIDDSFSLLPEYREDILPMIHNLKCYGAVLGDIVQYNDHLYTKLVSRGNQIGFNEMHILNMPYNNPTPEDVLYATRFMQSVRKIGSTVGSDPQDVFQLVCGSENISDMELYCMNDDGTFDSYQFTTYTQVHGSSSQMMTQLTEWASTVSELQQFDWAPNRILLKTESIQSGVFPLAEYAGDLANYTTIDTDTLERIHFGDFCGLYNIPYTLVDR